MKRQFILTVCLILIGANYAFSQVMQPRDLNQIRTETSARNQAIDDYDRRNPNNINSPLVSGSRNIHSGKIPNSEIRSYVLAAQVSTEVKILAVGDGDKVLVDDGTNQQIIRILGIDAPELGQPFFKEAKENLSKLLTGKKVLLVYSLHNLKDAEGYFPARIFVDKKDVGLNLLETGFAWRNVKDKFFIEKKDDEGNELAEAKARLAKTGIWQEAKPQKPWEYRENLAKEKEKAAKN